MDAHQKRDREQSRVLMNGDRIAVPRWLAKCLIGYSLNSCDFIATKFRDGR